MRILCGTILAIALTVRGAAATLEDVPWIGDGLPERNGADWYDEDPAPEFMAEFAPGRAVPSLFSRTKASSGSTI